MVTGFILMLAFFMFQTKTNGFQVMDIGLYCGLIIIGLSFHLIVCRGLIVSMGSNRRICFFCFWFLLFMFFLFLISTNSPTPQQWMLWSFFIFTLSRKVRRTVLCSAIVVLMLYTSTAVKSCWFFWNLPFHVRGQ